MIGHHAGQREPATSRRPYVPRNAHPVRFFANTKSG